MARLGVCFHLITIPVLQLKVLTRGGTPDILSSYAYVVLVMGSTDVSDQSPRHCVCMMSSVWTQSAEVMESVREQSVSVTPRGLEECVRLSTAPVLTAPSMGAALMVGSWSHIMPISIVTCIHREV